MGGHRRKPRMAMLFLSLCLFLVIMNGSNIPRHGSQDNDFVVLFAYH